ncbi:MAG: MaoC/PaaZ C-terminal domain-containing protein [Gammaproteobacteria bacterium]
MNDAQAPIYFDDLTINQTFEFGPYLVEEEELLAFNRKWDPLPIHLDDDAARAKGFRSKTASGQYTLCVKQHFVNQCGWTSAVIGAMGFDEVRFPNPVYVGDEIFAEVEVAKLRASKTKPDRGIVTLNFRLYKKSAETVLTYIDTVMFARRPAAS